MAKKHTDIEPSASDAVETSLEKRVTRLEFLVRKILERGEIHWGKMGSSRMGVLIFVALVLVGLGAYAATQTVVDFTKGSAASAAMAKITYDTSTTKATLAVDVLSAGITNVSASGNFLVNSNLTVAGTGNFTLGVTMSNSLTVATNVTASGFVSGASYKIGTTAGYSGTVTNVGPGGTMSNIVRYSGGIVTNVSYVP